MIGAVVAMAAAVTILGSCSDAGDADTATKSADRNSARSYVLAISWQPAFCETHSRKAECREQRSGDSSTRQFSLHGLWPQPGTNIYCNVAARDVEEDKSGRWRSLPMARLPDTIWKRLQEAMPGTRSHLHRHEWIKHGTCMPTPDNIQYFETSLNLLETVNASALTTLFRQRIGKNVTAAEIRSAFETDFGAGAGSRLRISCERDGSRQIIDEITVGLKGDVETATGKQAFSALVQAAAATDPGCPGGIVDPVGLQ